MIKILVLSTLVEFRFHQKMMDVIILLLCVTILMSASHKLVAKPMVSAWLAVLIVMMVMHVQMTLATLRLDARMCEKLVTTIMPVLMILVIRLLVASTLPKLAMIPTDALLMVAILPMAALSRHLLVHLINVLMLNVSLLVGAATLPLTAMTKMPVLLTPAIRLLDANTNLSLVTMVTHVL